MAQNKPVSFGPVPHKVKKDTKPVSTVSTPLDDFEAWLMTNWKIPVVILAVVAVIIVAVTIIGHVRTVNDKTARETLANAVAVEALEQAIQTYGSHFAADAARLRLSALHIAAKKYDKAGEVLKTVANSAKSDTFIRARAALDAAYLLEAQNKVKDAIREFERISANLQVNEALRAEAACAAARCALRIGDAETAKRSIAKVNQARGNTGENSAYAYWASVAQRLGEKLPKTTAPVKK